MSDRQVTMMNPQIRPMRPSATNPANERTRVPQLRICVTVPCGKKCVYCRPGGEGFEASSGSELTAEQMAELTAMFVEAGVRDVKLTGGDPMLRKDIVEIIRRIRAIDGVRSLHLVTRHPRAGQLAAEMRDAGLDVLNFSIDSLDPHTWTAITGVKGHARLIQAVDRAAATGITVKLNTVVMAGVNDHELTSLVEFAGRYNAELKLLDLIDDIPEFMQDGAPQEQFSRRHFVNLDDVVPLFSEDADAIEIDTQPGGLGHPMPRLQMKNGATLLIKSSTAGAWYGAVCEGCQFFPCHDALMAVRLTADGCMQFCLLREDNLVGLWGMLRRGNKDDAELAIAAGLKMYRDAYYMEGEEIARQRPHRRMLPLTPTTTTNMRP